MSIPCTDPCFSTILSSKEVDTNEHLLWVIWSRDHQKTEMTDKRPETENTETEPKGSKLASSVKKIYNCSMSCKWFCSASPLPGPIYQAWLTYHGLSPLCFVLRAALKCVYRCLPPSQSLFYTFTSEEGRKFPRHLRKVARQVGCLLKPRSHWIKGWPHQCCFLKYRSHVPSSLWAGESCFFQTKTLQGPY